MAVFAVILYRRQGNRCRRQGPSGRESLPAHTSSMAAVELQVVWSASGVVAFIGPVVVFPGSLAALARGVETDAQRLCGGRCLSVLCTSSHPRGGSGVGVRRLSRDVAQRSFSWCVPCISSLA